MQKSKTAAYENYSDGQRVASASVSNSLSQLSKSQSGVGGMNVTFGESSTPVFSSYKRSIALSVLKMSSVKEKK